MTVHLSGGDPRRATPAQALDGALADPEFARAVLASDSAGWFDQPFPLVQPQGLDDAACSITVRAGGGSLSDGIDGLMPVVDARGEFLRTYLVAVIS